MSSTHAATSQSERTDKWAAIIALVLLPFAIYAAFAFSLGVIVGVGFCVIVPSVIGFRVAQEIVARGR
jgi:hypothetical protein